jgi:ParB family chromosome partitioning protein
MKRLPQYDAYELPVADIHYDEDFNCRGSFTPQSVHDLSESIKENGLQFPVVVQPYDQVPGCQYRLLAGHRRYRAVTVFLKWEKIPAVVRDDLDEHQARILNLTENLERKDLNMLEEAKALRNLYPEGISLRSASQELKRPTRWIHARLRLLDLPEEVQKWAATGVISALNIEAIHKLESDEERITAANEIIRCKTERGKTRPLDVDAKYKRKFQPRKTKQQLADMIAHLYNVHCEGLGAMLLAWAAGKMSDEQIDEAICNAPTYQSPEGYESPYRSED